MTTATTSCSPASAEPCPSCAEHCGEGQHLLRHKKHPLHSCRHRKTCGSAGEPITPPYAAELRNVIPKPWVAEFKHYWYNPRRSEDFEAFIQRVAQFAVDQARR